MEDIHESHDLVPVHTHGIQVEVPEGALECTKCHNCTCHQSDAMAAECGTMTI